MKLSERVKDAFFLAVAAAILGGSNPVAAKIGLEVFGPFTLIVIRFISATLCLLPFAWKSGGLKGTKLRTFIPVGIVGALNPIILYIALQFTQASASPFIYAGVPLMTAVYFYFTKGARLSRKQTLGIIVGFLGVSVVVLLPMFQQHVTLAALRGNVLIICSAIAFMFYGMMSKEKQLTHNASPIVLTFYFSLVTMILSAPFAYWELTHRGITGVVQAKHILSAVYSGVFGTSLFYFIYQYALKLSTEVAASLFTYIQPVATVGLAVALLGEKITLPFLFGGILAVFGARLASHR